MKGYLEKNLTFYEEWLYYKRLAAVVVVGAGGVVKEFKKIKILPHLNTYLYTQLFAKICFEKFQLVL